MINFTVGPVQMDEEVRALGGEQIPYFRTPEFSAVMLENERLMKTFAGAGEDSRVVFLTGSGTAAMEAAVMNLLTPDDRAIVVNGGSFGERFAALCRIHGIPHTEIRPGYGHAITAEHLAALDPADYTAFVVNLNETSTGVLYDLNLISDFCRRNHLFLIVDAISAFLADEINFSAAGIDAMLTGSQKALACPPGVSVLVLSARAQERAVKNDPKIMYLNLRLALENGTRGQTPFTPAVGTLLQIHRRLLGIEARGGAAAERRRIGAIAADFRAKIAEFPFRIASDSLSNAVTPLRPERPIAYDIFLRLKDEYGIWVCPNGGELRETTFRVGHIGDLTTADNDALIFALRDLQNKHFF